MRVHLLFEKINLVKSRYRCVRAEKSARSQGLVLYLPPKRLVQKYKVGEARKVFLKQLDDDSLLVRFNSLASQNDRSYVISLDTEDVKEKYLDKEEYMDYLFNTFLAAYQIGYKRVIFKKRTKIPMQIQNKITAMTRTFHGMVIISESPTEVVIEDTSSSIDIKLLMRQMLSKVGLYLANLIEVIEHHKKWSKKAIQIKIS